MEFLIYILPIFVIGIFIFIIAWSVHSENKEIYKNSRDVEKSTKTKEEPLYDDIDSDFFCSKKSGIYDNYNDARVSHTSVVKDFIFNIENVYKVIQKYYRTLNINHYLIQFRTKSFLSEIEEKTYRDIVKECGGNISIIKDVSTWGQEKLDMHIVNIKVSFENMQRILLMVQENNIDSIVIVDDYNPTIFTDSDKFKAFNYNYRIKLHICINDNISNLKNKCNILLSYGIVKNTKQFLISSARLIGGQDAQIDYYEGMVI